MTSADNKQAAPDAEIGSRDAGGVLVLGECLADVAPAPPPRDTAAGAIAAASPQTEAGEQFAPASTKAGPLSPAHVAPGPTRQYLVAMPGGGPANVAVGLARLGVRCAFAGRFSRRGFGPWLRRHLADEHVDLGFSVEADELATIALVTLDSNGRASYTFYGATTADWQWQDHELPEIGRPRPGAPRVDAVHTGSLALALEPGAGAITRWLATMHRESQVLISFDPNVRPGVAGDITAYRERLAEILTSAHIVKASHEDVDAVYPGASPRSVADKWLSLGVSLVVITAGPMGATAFHSNGAGARSTPPLIRVADTIGAGDAFTAALLAYFAEHELLSPGGIAQLSAAHLQASIAQAVMAGALTCTRPGADPPTRPELDHFMDKQG